MAGQLAGIGMSFVDTVMAGSLSSQALAAVAVGSSVWSSISLFMMGVLMALPPWVAQLDGAGERGKVGPLVRQALWLALGLAGFTAALARNLGPIFSRLEVQAEIVPTVEAYLAALTWGAPGLALFFILRFLCEGLSSTRPTMYFGAVGLIVNVGANYALMYGRLGFPALGAVGCGYATAVVWWTQAAGLLLYVAAQRRYRALELFTGLEAPERPALAELLRIGLPIGAAFFMEASLFTVVALLIGSLGTAAVAGHQVALNFCAVTFMLPLGISMAASVRVGHAVGRRDRLALRRAALAGAGLAMLCQVVSASVMLTLPERVAGIYTDDRAVIAIAVRLLFLAAVFQLSDGLQVSAAGALRGLKDTRAPMLITAVAYWLVGIPLGWLLGFRAGLGAEGLWMGLIAGLTLAALLLSLRFFRVARRVSAPWASPTA